MRFCVLASGSKANATFVEAGTVRFLIDAGLSGIELQRRLAAIGVEPSSLAAILLTHEHSDHVRGVSVLSKRFGVTVYANRATLTEAGSSMNSVHAFREFDTGSSFQVDGLTIHPFSVSHDAADPVGFVIDDGRYRLGQCTDTGMVTRLMRHRLSSCDALIVESNHDPDLLQAGPYPYYLKQRISGKKGHLSNQEAADLVQDVMHEDLSHVVLAHLSETNNMPGRARDVVCQTLASPTSGRMPRVSVAAQERVGEVLTLRE